MKTRSIVRFNWIKCVFIPSHSLFCLIRFRPKNSLESSMERSCNRSPQNFSAASGNHWKWRELEYIALYFLILWKVRPARFQRNEFVRMEFVRNVSFIFVLWYPSPSSSSSSSNSYYNVHLNFSFGKIFYSSTDHRVISKLFFFLSLKFILHRV